METLKEINWKVRGKREGKLGNMRVKKVWHFWETDKPFARPEELSAVSCPYCGYFCEITETGRAKRACKHFLYLKAKEGYAFFNRGGKQ